MNFRNASNPFNNPFYKFYLDDGGALVDDEVSVGKKTYATRVLDYRNCGDTAIRSLDRQTYFTNIDDMAGVIQAAGFDIRDHKTFHFTSPSNPDNEIDVFRIRAI